MRWLARFFGSRAFVTDEEIIKAIDPWMLGCAVGAQNGSIGMVIGFDRWLSQSRENWMPNTKRALGGRASEGRIVAALSRFVEANQHLDYRTVMKNASASTAGVIDPGKTKTLTAQISDGN